MRCAFCGKPYEVRVNPTEDVCPKCLCGTEEGIRRSIDSCVARMLERAK